MPPPCSQPSDTKQNSKPYNVLQLQRASAGSGKTYTLAKKFIWFLIAIKDDGRPWRLRTPGEISDGLPRILAVTFTNKATNEMKQRIVEKLAALARADGSEPVEREALAKTDYLKEFSESLGIGIEAVGKAAREALAVLLNDYSDFKVSTIDSFFQTILRTFAYESNLNDSYQVEIDSDFLAAAAVDATLDSINNSADDSKSSFWMTVLMNREAEAGRNTWNVFQKSLRQGSIYTELRKAIMRLENENFKEIRDKIDAYFDTPDGKDPLAEAYTTLRTSLEASLKEPLAEARKHAGELKRLFSQCGLEPSVDGHRWLGGHLRKLDRMDFDESSASMLFKPLQLDAKTRILKKGVTCEKEEEMTRVASMMYEAYTIWNERRENGPWKLWSVYATLIPYLGLLGEARMKIREYLDANNTIQLGETNSMLRRIIGDDDAPFIYERLGSTINHYLIDEFQDTSRLQWENLRPLLGESDSRGKDNLIIGDAKQSIYRFRNADPSLITTSVPDSFPRHIEAGMTKEDNTNWRSDRTIVEFNNSFFKALALRLEEESKGNVDFANLYCNVAQFPSHRERRGYVRIDFLTLPPESERQSSEDARRQRKEKLLDEALGRIGPLVASLIARGYRQRDIALLVDTNELGKAVIAALVQYNASLPGNSTRIGFISEESLLVSSSEAVGIIVSVLEKMTSGSDTRPQEGSGKTGWNEIRCNFSFYALRHPEMSPAEQVKGFMSEESPVDSINAMLAGMQTVALPALVEAVTENFVPKSLRVSQAAFIAAFQDLMLEYCDRYAADVASFLQWWKAKGSARSISSPEDTDAVQIMTIHKSKGLEFKCVILPFSDSSLVPTPRKSEWKWVAPAGYFADKGLPPYLPVETTSKLVGTPHERVWMEYSDLHVMDRLNSAYVAFTRAVSELYIFTGMPERKSSKTLGAYLYSICAEDDSFPASYSEGADADFMLPESFGIWDEEEYCLSFGELPVPEAADESDGHSGKCERVITEYGVDSSPAILHYVEGDDEDASATMLPDAADTDPRSEGNLLHAVMASVRVREDIPRAVTALRMKGLVSSATAAEWIEMLDRAVSSQPAAGWFHPSWRVLNERAILFGKSPTSRPDRIMIAPDGRSAVIIDYKFGAEPEGTAHIRQVRRYKEALALSTGIGSISGFVWYVRLGKIVAV